jgi:hypothetical protein
MKKIYLFLVTFLIIIPGLSACNSANVTNEDVKDAAITAISQHDHVYKEEVNVIEIRGHDNEKNAWTVSYQTRDVKYGIWIPVDGWQIVEIKKSSNGKLNGEFFRYGM